MNKNLLQLKIFLNDGSVKYKQITTDLTLMEYFKKLKQELSNFDDISHYYLYDDTDIILVEDGIFDFIDKRELKTNDYKQQLAEINMVV